MSEMQISVILPIYNERENLVPLFTEIDCALRLLTDDYEIIAVDDGSTDGCTSVLREWADVHGKLRMIRFRQNYGQSAAFDAGFREARGRYVVTMDADGQNDPADIPAMIAAMEKNDWDFVEGIRARRKDGFVLRRLPSRLANWLIRRVTRTRLHDLGCSLKVYRREIAQELRLYGEMHRFIGVLVEGIGARTGEIPVHHRPRSFGRSKYGITRTFKVLLDLLTVWFMRGYQTKPIYVFGGCGMALAFISILLSGFVLYEKLAWGVWVHRNPLFVMSMIGFIVAVQFLMLGLLAEIVVRTYFESRQKPSYLIAERIGPVEDEPEDRVAVTTWSRPRVSPAAIVKRT